MLIALVLCAIVPSETALDERKAWVEKPTVVSAPSPIGGFPVLASAIITGGDAYHYIRRTAVGETTTTRSPVAALGLDEQWLATFFGDKAQLAAFIEQTAEGHGLPVEFLMRLLRQESGLNHQAVSRAGALGVAQFMPATAKENGLADPFDPFEAVPKAANLLREYRDRFGNLGLAAAAYNAGPKRVTDWLSGRGSLPRETQDYVLRITDRAAEDWRQYLGIDNRSASFTSFR